MVKISNKSILFDLSKSPFLSYHGIDAEKTIGNNSNGLERILERKMDIWYILYRLLMAVIPFIKYSGYKERKSVF